MQIASKYHGILDIRTEDVVHLVRPLLGFDAARRFILLPHAKDSPFLYFQSADQGDLCFIVVDPLLFVPDYALTTEDVEGLGNPDEWAVLSLCTIIKDKAITINLRSPVVINKNTRQGGQFVLALGYPHQYPILQEAAHAGINPKI